MKPEDLIVPPPTPRMVDYPVVVNIALGILFTALLLFISSKFDSTHGTLTVSLLVVLTFVGVATFCLFFTVPNDQITSGVIGGLTAAFGAVISYWLARTKKDGD